MSHEKECKNKDLWGIVMSLQKDNTFQFSQYMKSDKMSYIIYAELESLIKKIDECENNLEKYSTTEIGEHVSCRCSMSIIRAFDNIENKILLKSFLVSHENLLQVQLIFKRRKC